MLRTPEQRAADHKERRERRRRNQAGRRRAGYAAERRRMNGVSPAQRWWTPSVYETARLLLEKASHRYLLRYGLPLPTGWHSHPRPRMPRLNAGGGHHHPVAMARYRSACRRDPLPYSGWRRDLRDALRYELQAAALAPPHARPYLLRTAAWIAAHAGWPAVAAAVAAAAGPDVVDDRWPAPADLAAGVAQNLRRRVEAAQELMTRIVAVPEFVLGADAPLLTPVITEPQWLRIVRPAIQVMARYAQSPRQSWETPGQRRRLAETAREAADARSVYPGSKALRQAAQELLDRADAADERPERPQEQSPP